MIDLEAFRTAPEAVEWARTPNEPAGTLEHFCLEVDDFDIEATAAELRAAGHEVVEVPPIPFDSIAPSAHGRD